MHNFIKKLILVSIWSFCSVSYGAEVASGESLPKLEVEYATMAYLWAQYVAVAPMGRSGMKDYMIDLLASGMIKILDRYPAQAKDTKVMSALCKALNDFKTTAQSSLPPASAIEKIKMRLFQSAKECALPIAAGWWPMFNDLAVKVALQPAKREVDKTYVRMSCARCDDYVRHYKVPPSSVAMQTICAEVFAPAYRALLRDSLGISLLVESMRELLDHVFIVCMGDSPETRHGCRGYKCRRWVSLLFC
ncbi:MAG: hypothetical protein QG604_339 [Candidatus Dependentiae bacterium]|nr:hypothetical protein [Candidatus Dependentiae bacterium]